MLAATHLPNSEIKLFIQTVEGSQHTDRFETHKQLENTQPMSNKFDDNARKQIKHKALSACNRGI